MAEKMKQTSKKRCSCGFMNRKGDAGQHMDGTHHKAGKKVVEVKTGVKTNVGDPGDRIKK